MKFMVTRVSEHGCGVNPPCNGAKLIHEGRFVNYYGIEINSIEELAEFIKDHGSIVISEGFSAWIMRDIDLKEYFGELEIYDGRRE